VLEYHNVMLHKMVFAVAYAIIPTSRAECH